MSEDFNKNFLNQQEFTYQVEDCDYEDQQSDKQEDFQDQLINNNQNSEQSVNFQEYIDYNIQPAINDLQNSENIQAIIDMIQNYLKQGRNEVPKIEESWLSYQSEFIKGLFFKIQNVYEHCIQQRQQLNEQELFYGFCLWLILEIEKNKSQKQPQQQLDKKKSPTLKLSVDAQIKMNSILKVIRLNQYTGIDTSTQIPSQIIEFYLNISDQLNYPNLFLTVFKLIIVKEQQFDIQINYVMSKYLIALNQHQEAEYIVNQMILLNSGDKQFEMSFLMYTEVAFQCYSDVKAIQSLYEEAEIKMKNENLENKFKLHFSYCQSLKRLGEPQKLRDVLFQLGQGDQNAVLELYELLIYTNRLPYVAKVIYSETIKENTVDEFSNDKTKIFIELLNKACIQNIEKGSIEYKYIFQIIQLGQEYPKLMQEAKDTYLSDINKELDEFQQSKEYFILKEHQILSKYVNNYMNDILKSDEEVILKSIQFIDEKDSYTKSNYLTIHYFVNIINIFKMNGQYENAVKAIKQILESFFHHFIDEFFFFSDVEVFPKILKSCFAIHNSQQLKRFEAFDYVSYITATQLKKQLLLEPKLSDKKKKEKQLEIYSTNIEFHSSIKKQQNNEFLIYYDLNLTMAQCLLYQKQYQEALILVQQMMLAIIYNEGQYSYSLLPFLSLHAELATYQSEKTLASLSKLLIKKILNEEESIEQADLSFLKKQQGNLQIRQNR